MRRLSLRAALARAKRLHVKADLEGTSLSSEDLIAVLHRGRARAARGEHGTEAEITERIARLRTLRQQFREAGRLN